MLLNSPIQRIRKKFATVMVDLRMPWRPFWLLKQHSCIKCAINCVFNTTLQPFPFFFYNIHHCPVLLTSLQKDNVFILWQYFYHYLIYDWHNSVWKAITSTIIDIFHSHVTMYSTSGWSLKLIYHLEKNISGKQMGFGCS